MAVSLAVWTENWNVLLTLHYILISNAIILNKGPINTIFSYLNEPVLWSQSGMVCRWSGVQGADVLSGPRPITVEVEPVAHLRPHQVAQTWNEFGWFDLGPGLGLGLAVSFCLGRSFLEQTETSICNCLPVSGRKLDTFAYIERRDAVTRQWEVEGSEKETEKVRQLERKGKHCTGWV